MDSSRRSRFVFCVFVFAVSTLFSGSSQAQTIRSRQFSGTSSGWVRFPSQPQFDVSVPMTIEAWVFHESTSFLQYIVHHGSGSYSLGFNGDNKLVFSRWGTGLAVSTVVVANRNWTHVAVTYDGTTTRFYVDGNAAGSGPLTNNGANVDAPLVLGARALDDNEQPAVANMFDGYLDEVRLWSVARTQNQIRNARFHEPRSGTPGLAAVFASAGPFEELSVATGTSGAGAVEKVFGILPRDLNVPLAAVTPCVDGTINLGAEYSGAEQLVIRYRDPVTQSQTDAVAYLVHADGDLYIGIKDVYQDATPLTSWIGVLLDPLGSRNPLAESTDVHLKAILLDPFDAADWLIGDGVGGYAPPSPSVDECSVACGAPGCFTWQHAIEFCVSEFDGPCHEFRITSGRIGALIGEDGLALSHFWVNGTPGFDHFGPGDALWNQPATWARVRYNSNQAVLPRVTITGHVYDGSGVEPQGNYPVILFAGSTEIRQVQTSTNGVFSFDEVSVSPTAQLRVKVGECSDCCGNFPTVVGSGTPRPLSAHLSDVVFPPCPLAASPCNYPTVNFHLRRRHGPITITNASLPEGHGLIVLRDLPLKELPPTEVVLTGTGFSDCMTVWFRPGVGTGDCEDFPTTCGLLEAKVKEDENHIRSISADGTSVTVITPENPTSQFNYPGSWTIHDHFAGGSWEPSAYAPGPGFVIHPWTLRDYSKIFGFEFENVKDTHSWKTFTAVYGKNSYFCAGAEIDGSCVGCRLPHPWVLLWFPVYLSIMNGEGMCTGMASTSLDLFHGDLSVEDFQEGVNFPAGLRGKGPSGLGPKQANNDWFLRRGAGRPVRARTVPPVVCDGCEAVGCSSVMLQSRTCWGSTRTGTSIPRHHEANSTPQRAIHLPADRMHAA